MSNETGFSPDEAMVQKMKLAREAVKAGASAEDVMGASKAGHTEATAERVKQATEIFQKAVAEGDPNPAARVVEIMGAQKSDLAAGEAQAELKKLAELVAETEQRAKAA